jgi:NAD(P)-dependent dehydrogenase (short-subunit alcohol dehydrogenase family)
MKSLNELMDLRGRVAVVTGATGHIGRAICDALAELGAGVVVLDLKPEVCRNVATSLHHGYGVESIPLAIDLSDDQCPPQIALQVLDHFGQLDILINCAAFVGTSDLSGWNTDFENQGVEAWRQAVELNLTVPFRLTQACAAALKRSGHGSVVNVASIYGIVGPDLSLYAGTPMNNPAAYAASKGGLMQLTRWLSTVMAPDVRVNTLTPGGIARNQPEVFQQRYVARTPLGRMGTEEEMKGAVAYLASDLSAYVTGHNLIVDGGWTAW